MKIIRNLQNNLLTLFYCFISGLSFDKTWYVRGKIIIKKRSFLSRLFKRKQNGELLIGENFQCINKPIYNTIGLIQPCFFNISNEGSRLVIGQNVGISGSTINATKSVSIGNNTIIGSGCLITDSDSHPIDPEYRLLNIDNVRSLEIVIGENVFIGARTIILKGVSIGNNSVIGAGSVVVHSIPENCIAAGNPAKVIKYLDYE